eukprot:TRINITY_DN56120_c0_g1_i2.p2 TRINITY_DN56120_c0_g1~~TRINITY_DN56120_c0_g1_i2.p2  ORF type:complete len:257 (+),score=47.25 TRINITY_DN56120_c0_g1_i2:17-787(+)
MGLFFFKQKTAYEIGLGIPAEPLFRSGHLPKTSPRGAGCSQATAPGSERCMAPRQRMDIFPAATGAELGAAWGFFFSSRRRHTRSVSAFLLNRSSDLAARIADPVARLQMQLSRWRAGALLSGAVAAALAAVIVMRTGDVPVPVAAPMAIAQLGSMTSGPLVLARYDPQTVAMRLHIVGISDTALSPELWVIPDGGAPISLGLIPRAGRTAVPLSAQQRQLLVEGATLAVTMEPEGGAPHAAPSSAPVAAGKISIL